MLLGDEALKILMKSELAGKDECHEQRSPSKRKSHGCHSHEKTKAAASKEIIGQRSFTSK
jgi:hypothetical protein